MRGQIPRQFLDTTISVYKKTNTQDSVGDMTQATSMVYSGIPANIQPDTSQISFDLQGITHIQTHFCFINTYDESGTKYELRPSHEIMDDEKGNRYLILGIEWIEAGHKQIEKGGYMELALKHISDERYEVVTKKTVKVKARINDRDFIIKAKTSTAKGRVQ